MKADPFARLVGIIRELERGQIHYRVTRNRSEGITVEATVPGERWEIDVLEDGPVDFERFVTAGGVAGEEELKESIARWAEPVEEAAE